MDKFVDNGCEQLVKNDLADEVKLPGKTNFPGVFYTSVIRTKFRIAVYIYRTSIDMERIFIV